MVYSAANTVQCMPESVRRLWRPLVVVVVIFIFCLIYVACRHVYVWSPLLPRAGGQTLGVRILGKPYCSHSILRDYYAAKNYFPGAGTWLVDEPSDDGARTLPVFQPDICQFRWNSIPGQEVRKCWEKLKVRKVVVIGDSNAIRYTWSFVYHLRKAFRCSVARRERMEGDGYLPDRDYFSRGNATLRSALDVQERFCHHCASEEWRCTARDLPNVSVEYISMSAIMDASLRVRIPRESWDRDAGGRYGHKLWAETYQEFLFRYYLAADPPSLLIMIPPFNHAKNLNGVPRVQVDLHFLTSMLDLYLPSPRTKTYWLTTFREFEAKRVAIPYWINATFNGVLAWQKIDELNRMLYRDIQEKLRDPGSGTFGFLDLVGVSGTRGDWSIDGVHLQPQWYDVMMTYLLELLCE